MRSYPVQLCIERSEEPGEMRSVHKRVIAQHRNWQQPAAIPLEPFTPGEARVAVSGEGRRIRERGIAQPGYGRYEVQVRRIVTVVEAPRSPCALLPGRGIFQILGQRRAGAQLTVAVCAIIEGKRVRGAAGVVFKDLASLFPMPELRNRVRCPVNSTQQAQEEWIADLA